MQINTKFNVGDLVYVCKDNSTYTQESCPTCKGRGLVHLEDKEFYSCPRCHGSKMTYTKFVKIFVPEKRRIRKIRVTVLNRGGKIEPYIKYETDIQGEWTSTVAENKNRIFTTLEDAEKRCDELNRDIEQENL